MQNLKYNGIMVPVIKMAQYEKHLLAHPITVREIVSADYLTRPMWDEENHIHSDAWELCCCLKGSLDIRRGDRAQPLQGGQVLLIPPGSDHLVGMRREDSAAFVISFTCSADNHLRLMQDMVIHASGSLLISLENIREELEMSYLPEENQLHLTRFAPSGHSPFGAEQMIASYLEQFIIRLLRSVTMDQGKVVSGSGFRAAMQQYLAEQVVSYIRENMAQPLTVEQIASHFHYSRARLTAICKQVTSLGVNELIVRERISAARKMLRTREKTVAQIAQELGFSSPHYFSWKFKQLTGCAPSHYAENGEE